MAKPLAPPPKKDPQRRTRTPLLPPMERSRSAMTMTAAAAEGRLVLQVCTACRKTLYPPREACPYCLGMDLKWTEQPEGGGIIAETTVHTSIDPYFRERMPWRMGTVQMDCGATALMHLHSDCVPYGRVRVRTYLDKGGQCVLMALPEKDTPNMRDDNQLREMTCDLRHRRVLITQGRSPVGAAMAAALADADCSTVFVGVSETWRRDRDLEVLEAMGHVEIMPLDVTDTISVRELCAEIGGKVDILINTADHVRPGGVMNRPDVVTAKDEFEVNCFGLMRLAQSFGAAMTSRGADGVNNAVAWVNVLSVFALSNRPDFGSNSASHAAAYSISQCLRAEMRRGGIRVMNVFTGPVDDEWRRPLPPPKVAPERIAKMIINGLIRGVEDIWVGDIANDIKERLRKDPKVLERELTALGA